MMGWEWYGGYGMWPVAWLFMFLFWGLIIVGVVLRNLDYSISRIAARSGAGLEESPNPSPAIHAPPTSGPHGSRSSIRTGTPALAPRGPLDGRAAFAGTPRVGLPHPGLLLPRRS